MLWIPFWAAGVINGVGHFLGYRNFDCDDASRNIVPLGILIGGEELHNNHHAYASSAKLSSKWYEFDIGWLYIRILEMLGLAQVKKVAPRVRLITAKAIPDEQTLQAVITHRYEVLASYAKSLKTIYVEEIRKLRQFSSYDAAILVRFRRWLTRDHRSMSMSMRASFASALSKSKPLATTYYMRQELTALWQRSSASREQLVKRLEDWCRSAEQSGIPTLVEFSRRLRCYA
jgi:stearoyl-CoA desaturase (delta-9 desaturase)